MHDVLRRLFRSAATGPNPCGVAICMTALFLCSSNHVDAQVTTATLVGLVRDNSAAVIPGANLVVTNEGTGVTRESVTDANGEVVLSALPAGTYTVRIELTGFKTVSQRGIELGAGQTVRQTFTLEVGAMSERSEEHTSELQSLRHLVCRLLLEKKNTHRLTQSTAHT